MKKFGIIYSVAVLAMIALYGFNSNDKYPDSIDEGRVAMFESHFIKTISKNELNRQLERNFLPLFDKVTSVDAQHSDDWGYYYLVFGEKNNIEKIELLKIEKEDVVNETYTYFDFEGFTVTENTLYCYRGGTCVGCVIPDSLDCPILCGPYPIACD